MRRAALILLVLALAVVAVLLATGPGDLPAVPSLPPLTTATSTPRTTQTVTSTATPSPTPTSTAPQACRAFVHGTVFADGPLDQRTIAAQTWLAAHPGQQASVVVTDDILNAVAVRAAQDEPVRDLRIAIEPAGFRLSATAVAIGSFPIRALLVPSASAGRLRIDVRELDTDGLPFFFRGSVQDALARAADPAKWGIQMRVDGVATASGCAVVWGTT
jgi:hypothetical protein